jgi:hypothetical protein
MSMHPRTDVATRLCKNLLNTMINPSIDAILAMWHHPEITLHPV